MWCWIRRGQELAQRRRRGWRILGAQEIAYLSCDPATLARDLAVLTGSERKPESAGTDENKYEIAEVHLFDLFPQTFHIETLVRLRRGVMKMPAVAIAAAFAGGILLGLAATSGRFTLRSRPFPLLVGVVVIVLLLPGFCCGLARALFVLAAMVSLVVWVGLGCLAGAWRNSRFLRSMF